MPDPRMPFWRSALMANLALGLSRGDRDAIKYGRIAWAQEIQYIWDHAYRYPFLYN